MNKMPVLYSYYRSSASYRVRIGLNLKGVEYKTKTVHLLENGGMQHADEYRKLNPMRQVPSFVHNGLTLTQSLAILQYIDDVFPGTRLFPADPSKKAKCLQLCEVINSGIQPLHNLSVLQRLVNDYGFTDAQKREWTTGWIMKGLSSLESLLEVTAGSFCLGGEVSAADALLIPQVFSGKRFGADSDKFPNISRVYDRCMQMDAFQKAAPNNQPDFPG